MAELILMTSAPGPGADVLPALGLLPHQVRIVAGDVGTVLADPSVDVVLVDARRDLAGARTLCRTLATTGVSAPVVAIVAEGGLVAVSADWHLTDLLVDTAGPAEVEARLRLATTKRQNADDDLAATISSGDLVIDEATYSARLNGHLLDLTYKEFELLKYLAQYPGRVFTRAQLLQEVWGYDYFGGTRTVDVHVRRLRAKLGTEHEALIGTVRNVGYRFVPAETPR
ncbi:response regulator transcription factor [Austwickia sp. TVS 96-490-7B]|uniref:winged helix-turn-helix transcriptional regulator n=1 Tax=Austwickia sp. TVS 96-490-7B TaxID=2830843 RepID=UPI001C59F1D6|nr:response regulator transcription factor [Austwickia sp. TVS 96-490-7B]